MEAIKVESHADIIGADLGTFRLDYDVQTTHWTARVRGNSGRWYLMRSTDPFQLMFILSTEISQGEKSL